MGDIKLEPCVNDTDRKYQDRLALAEANKLIQTISIKGKDYAEGPQRVKAYRYVYPRGKIDFSFEFGEVERINKEGEVIKRRTCKCAAFVYDDEGNFLARGDAEEIEGSSQVNATSYIENAQTSATGRALGFAGYGIDTSIASYEEVVNARAQQGENAEEDKKATMKQTILLSYGYDEKECAAIRKRCGVESNIDIPKTVMDVLLELRKEKIKEEKKKAEKEVPQLMTFEEKPFYG